MGWTISCVSVCENLIHITAEMYINIVTVSVLKPAVKTCQAGSCKWEIHLDPPLFSAIAMFVETTYGLQFKR